MTNIIQIEKVTEKIDLIRGLKVMLDRDLAELYGIETKVLKQAVRRNISRFPDDFMFELSKKEYQSLRSQNVTLKRGQHSKYLPFVFTEQGVAMLSSVLKNEKAVHVNIQIMRAFIIMRKMSISDDYNPSQKCLLAQYLCWCLVFNPSIRLRRTSDLKLGSAARVPATYPGEVLTKTEAFKRRRNLEPKSHF